MDSKSTSFMSFSIKTTEAHSKPTKKHSAVVPRSLQKDTGKYIYIKVAFIC